MTVKTDAEMDGALLWTLILLCCLQYSCGIEEAKGRCPEVCEMNHRPSSSKYYSINSDLLSNSLDTEFQFFDLALSLVKTEAYARLHREFYDKRGCEVDWSNVSQKSSANMNTPYYFNIIFQVTDLLRSYAVKYKKDSIAIDLYKLWWLADTVYTKWLKETRNCQLYGRWTGAIGTNDRNELVVFIWQKTAEDLADLFNGFCNRVCDGDRIVDHFA